jgi:hypothetical protein
MSISPLTYGEAHSDFSFDTSPVHLTTHEQKLLKNIFGDEVNPSIVRKFLEPDPHKTGYSAMTFNARDMAFYESEYHADDYSQTTPLRFSYFIHEATHIWQRQSRNPDYHESKKCKTYEYALSESAKFEDYCNEQQASIIEDYALRFHCPAPEPSYSYSANHGHDTPQSDALLQKLVEDRFPIAKQTRLAVEATRIAKASQTKNDQAFSARIN